MATLVPQLQEIAATVERREGRLRTIDSQSARELMDAYRTTARRFESDLSDPRDIALSKGGALMLIKVALEKR